MPIGNKIVLPDWQLRVAAGQRLIDWGIVAPNPDILIGDGSPDDPVYGHLAWLLNYENGEHFMFGFREDDREKLELLLGPYGLTIYKIMVLKKNIQGLPCVTASIV